MRRLTLLLFMLSLAVAAPVAHGASAGGGGSTATAAQAPGDRDGDGTPDSSDQCPDAPGGSAYQGCPAPSDRDQDGTPDSSDQCPDAPGGSYSHGCPPPPDRDGDSTPDASDRCPDERGSGNFQGCPQEKVDADMDGVIDTDDRCPDSWGKQANGCDPFAFRYFFGVQKGVADFAADKRNDTVYCAGGPQECTRAHMTFTLSAQTAKAAGITKRLIGSVSVALPSRSFDRGISRANGKKLARLKKITVTIRAWAVLITGEKVTTPDATITILRKRYVSHQFNNVGTNPDEV